VCIPLKGIEGSNPSVSADNNKVEITYGKKARNIKQLRVFCFLSLRQFTLEQACFTDQTLFRRVIYPGYDWVIAGISMLQLYG
jgi:hypothetical protein